MNFEDNWKTWLLIGLLALGGVVEVLKNVPLGRGRVGVQSLLETEASPYSVNLGTQKPVSYARKDKKDSTPALTKAQLEAFLAANSLQKTDFNHKEKGDEGKKKNAKKKKKKAAKKNAKKSNAVAVDEDFESQRFKHAPDVDSTLRELITTNQVKPVAPAEEKDEATTSLEEWMKRLLNQPDMKETRRFIEAYQNGLVTDEIFYKIVSMMVEDSRIEMQKLGVLALGLTPSKLSFQMLAELQIAKTTSSELSALATQLLNRYTDIGHLQTLEQVMRQGNSTHATLLATQLLDQSAKQYLTPTANDNTEDGSVLAQEQAPPRNARLYERFITVLLELSKSPDSAVATQAQQTLVKLQSLLQKSSDNLTAQSDVDAPTDLE